MDISMHSASVPVFGQFLGSLERVLDKAEAHAQARKIEPDALLHARLFPDMLDFTRQVQIACDFAKSVSARLADADVPAYEDDERGFGELRERVAKTRNFIDALDPSAFEGSAARTIVLRPGTPKERSFDGHAYLVHYGLPQFFFHVTTAYALLRHNGVEIGKLDYMNAP